MMVNKQQIIDGIKKLGLCGKPVCLHSSLKSFGYVEGGAQTIIDGFIDEGCTIIVPTHSYSYQIKPEDGFEDAKIFKTTCNDISGEAMGIIPTTILKMKNRVRGYHPMDSFTGIGPLAKVIIQTQSLSNVYGPLKKMINYDGYIILMGVGLNKMTAIHLAEEIAGREMFDGWVLDETGEPEKVYAGDCSHGFTKLDPVLKSIESQVKIGDSLWRIFPVKETLALASEAIKKDPMITVCDPDCKSCKRWIPDEKEKI